MVHSQVTYMQRLMDKYEVPLWLIAEMITIMLSFAIPDHIQQST